MRLGDVVYTITKWTGIYWLVKSISKLLGVDCGCDARRDKWNKISDDWNKINRNG